MKVLASPAAPGALPEEVWCRACGGAGLEPFTGEDATPVNNARVFADAEAARRTPTGPLQLALCPTCGFIQNVLFRPALVTYDSGYEEQQSFSPTFTAFADGLAADLVSRWGLHGKRIVEIGCGKGDFLAKVCELGENAGVGYDPTAAASRLGDDAARVHLLPEFYDDKTGPLHADAVMCRHTLEHVMDVGRFVHNLRVSLQASPDARVFFEVPDVGRVLRDGAFWDVYYEHCSYFTPGSLARLFRSQGFIVDDVRLGFDDQYVLLEARLAPDGRGGGAICPAEETPESLRDAVAAYEQRVTAVSTSWADRVRAARERGERVAVWGSGSKCVSFLSTTGLDEGVDAVVDVNPHRQGNFLPRTAIQIQSPSVLRDVRPDLVIVMNAAYVPEITASLAAMNLAPHVEAVG